MSTEYYKSKNTVKAYIESAKDVNGAELIEQLKPYLDSNSTLLELGTGPGSDWKLLSENYHVIGSDYSQDFLDHLKKKNPEGQFLELDAITIETDEQFDGIYSNKVLHHLEDKEFHQSIQRQLEVLNPKGIICHFFWKGEGSEMFNGMFVNYHTEEEIRNAFDSNFEILVLKSYQEFEDGDSLLLIGRKIN